MLALTSSMIAPQDMTAFAQKRVQVVCRGEGNQDDPEALDRWVTKHHNRWYLWSVNKMCEHFKNLSLSVELLRHLANFS